MGRSPEQLRWQHRLTGHLADRAVPAVRVRDMVELDGLWYEISDVAAGRDVYSGVDTWEPFSSDAHVREAGRVLARLNRAGEDFTPAHPQPQSGFVVQLDLVAREPDEAVEELCTARPAVAAYLAGQAWREPVIEAYAELFDRLRPVLPELPRTALHGDWQTNNLFFDGDRISEGDDDAFDLHHAGLLVGAYHAETTLTGAERAALADVLAACQFEYGISFLDYYWGVERDREKADWAWHTFVLGHARWWQGEAGRTAGPRIAEIARSL
jgi:Ser/Thr protein kinase RdoA (MazF antagonist)